MGFMTFCTWGTATLSLIGALTALFIPGWATRTVYVADGSGGYCSHELGLGLLWTLEVETDDTGSSEDNDVCGDSIFDPSSLLWERTSCDTYPEWGDCPDTYWLGMIALVSMCCLFSFLNFIAMSYRLCCNNSYAKFDSESASFSKGPSCLTPKSAGCYSIMSLLCAICSLILWFSVLSEEYTSPNFREADAFATTQGSICVDFVQQPQQSNCIDVFPGFTGTDCYIGSCIDGSLIASETALENNDCLPQCGSKAVSDYSFNIDCVSVIGLILNTLFMFMQAQALSRGDDFDL